MENNSRKKNKVHLNISEIKSFLIPIGILSLTIFLSYGCAKETKETSNSPVKQNILTEFKITKNGGPILLPVTFIDKEHLFVLDTGSSHTVYDASLRHELGKVKKIESALTHGSPIKAAVFDAPEAFLGPLNLKDSNDVFCLDLTMLSLIEGRKISGIIGMNFLTRYVIRIDYDRETLSFLQPAEGQHFDWGIELPLRYDKMGLPHITSDILDNINVNFMIDTGSNSTGALAGDVFEKIMLEEKPKTAESLFATASGVIRNRECRIDSISVGPYLSTRGLSSMRPIGLIWACCSFLATQLPLTFPTAGFISKKAKILKRGTKPT